MSWVSPSTTWSYQQLTLCEFQHQLHTGNEQVVERMLAEGGTRQLNTQELQQLLLLAINEHGNIARTLLGVDADAGRVFNHIYDWRETQHAELCRECSDIRKNVEALSQASQTHVNNDIFLQSFHSKSSKGCWTFG